MTGSYGCKVATFDAARLREKYGRWFELSEATGGCLLLTLDDVARPGRTDTLAQTVMILACHCHTLHQAVVDLCATGYGVAAAVLTRSLFEGVVNAVYIAQDTTGARAAQYCDYGKELDLQLRGKLNRQPPRRKPDWEGSRIANRATAVGMRRLYDLLYWHDSQFVHANAGIISEVISVQPGRKPRIYWGPQDSDLIPRCLWYGARLLVALVAALRRLGGLTVETRETQAIAARLQAAERDHAIDFRGSGSPVSLSELLSGQ